MQTKMRQRLSLSCSAWILPRKCKNTILAGRADNPKEAINVMLDDAHKTNMEAMAAAKNAGVSAGFAAASFFLR